MCSFPFSNVISPLLLAAGKKKTKIVSFLVKFYEFDLFD